jgi:hypothetical protein
MNISARFELSIANLEKFLGNILHLGAEVTTKENPFTDRPVSFLPASIQGSN